jgi:hypothetical protein
MGCLTHGQNGQCATRHLLVSRRDEVWTTLCIQERKFMTKHDKKTLRGSRSPVSREPVTARRDATRPNEVASLMSHVSLAVHSREHAEPAGVAQNRRSEIHKVPQKRGAGWLHNTETWNSRENLCAICTYRRRAKVGVGRSLRPGVPRGPPRLGGGGRVRKPFPVRLGTKTSSIHSDERIYCTGYNNPDAGPPERGPVEWRSG